MPIETILFFGTPRNANFSGSAHFVKLRSSPHLTFGMAKKPSDWKESNSFISSVSDDGRRIVNSVFLLWPMNVITYHDNVPHVLELNNMYEAEADNSIVSLSNHIMPILRFLKSLHEFSMNKDTFTDPDAYLEMLFSSVAAEINKENSNEKLRSAKTASV